MSRISRLKDLCKNTNDGRQDVSPKCCNETNTVVSVLTETERDKKKKHTEHRQTVNACVSEREGKRSLGSHPTVYVCVSKLQCVRLCCALAG